MTEGLRLAAGELRALLTDLPLPTDSAKQALAATQPRFSCVGTGADAATALTGALIAKEAGSVAAEGYAGGAFRHGPLELCGSRPDRAALRHRRQPRLRLPNILSVRVTRHVCIRGGCRQSGRGVVCRGR
ncbi:hypothetical protein AB0E27_37545 [Streptomyces sparsogenes]|uniref:hypothetical protein n=1 Tax=Streptomyces sparsogenes TaxID=67365 RepID=UPI0033D637E3